jgi:hypothetical protein
VQCGVGGVDEFTQEVSGDSSIEQMAFELVRAVPGKLGATREASAPEISDSRSNARGTMSPDGVLPSVLFTMPTSSAAPPSKPDHRATAPSAAAYQLAHRTTSPAASRCRQELPRPRHRPTQDLGTHRAREPRPSEAVKHVTP